MAGTAVRTTVTCMAAVSVALTLNVVGAESAEAAVRPTAEVLMVKQINDAREARGLNRLVANLQMKRVARQWTAHMTAVNSVYHRPNLAAAVDGDYERLAENVGYTRLAGASDAQLVERLHRAFMASNGHRAQILGRFNMVGVGVQRLSNGRMFVTVNFLKGPLDGFPLYVDAARNAHEREIGSLYIRGAIRGCDSNSYCPGRDSSRYYVAGVLDRALRTSAASRWLDNKCGWNARCRHGEMTRVQLAVMIARVLDLPAGDGSRFTDVAAEHRGEVYAVARRDIMGGCSYSRFCPGGAVSRARAAAIVYRAVN